MHQYNKDKKLRIVNKKNNIYLKRIVSNFNRLKTRMNQSRKKKEIINLKIDSKSEVKALNLGNKSDYWRSYQEFIGLFKNSPEASVYTDLNGIILEINLQYELLTGFSIEESRGKYLRDLLNVHILEKKNDQHNSPGSEMRIRRKDGKNIFVDVSSASNFIQKEKIGKILLFKDITDRKRSEEVSQVLYDISNTANSSISLKKLYPVIRKELHKIIDTTNFYIALYEEEKESLEFCYYMDETGKKDEDLIHLKIKSSENIFYYIFKTGQALLLNYNKYKKMMREGYFDSHDVITNKQIWLGVPLKVEGKTIGSMVLQSYTNPKLYLQKDIKLMEFVSQQIATAIDRKRTEEKLKMLGLYDYLTGLPNRVLFYDRLKQEIAYARREDKKFALVFFDLDNFKKVNDKYGHDTGDRLLQIIAENFEKLLRKTDTICRLGGDEFIILLAKLVQPEENVKEVIQKIMATLSKPFIIEDNLISVSLSIGIVLYPDNGKTCEELIKNADKAMYRAKKGSKNYYHWAN